VKTMFLAAAAVVSLGMNVAFAQSSPSASGYVYPNFWGNQAAQTAPQAHAGPQSSGESISTFVTQTSQGTWLFPPNPNNGG
jgi:hypothetical protein